MKSTFSIFSFILILLFSTSTYAQSVESGKNLYQNEDYERALRIFTQIDSPEANLFSGKSYFSLGEFSKSKAYLNKVIDSDESTNIFRQEAKYTKALVLFQIDDFAASLELLHELKSNSRSNPYYTRAITFYDQILSYLSIDQIKTVFRQSSNVEILADVISGALGRVDFSKAKTMVNSLKSSLIDSSAVDLFQIEAALRDSLTYASRYPFQKYSFAPTGMSYQIGVALPSFDINSDNYEIPQHLYFGIQTAVEEFNANHPDKKVFINFSRTNVDSIQPEDILNHLVWNKDVDVVIGPLFSDVAKSFSDLAEVYEVPVITPLANSDSLSIANNYMFQTNPTFGVQGKKMAHYAVNSLGLDTVAVLAEMDALGEASALAFRHEAERLGAFVQHFFLKDLESDGYDISEYTAYLSKTDTLVPSPGLKAIYAPFTGAAAPTLIRNLLTDLEASRSDYILLGSEEWADTDLENIRLPETSIHYTQSFEIRYGETDVEEFASNFRLRFQTEPNQFAFIGYDVTKFILSTLNRVGNPDLLKQGLHELKNYRGLSGYFGFDSEHINQKVLIKSLYKQE
ncbi:MAG: ABC transporter substrate-binding protein [Balneola sp.]|jgi:ABC-type branched-subunit amino acid transport system substrate-binding protein